MNSITQLCRTLRNNATTAEVVLWDIIRRKNIHDAKFLRQYPIIVLTSFGRKYFYIADFYCAKHKLVIEVDGPIHNFKEEYDKNRDLAIEELGITVLRFTNDEVVNDLGRVAGKIMMYLRD